MSMKLMRCKTLCILVLLFLVPQLTIATTPEVQTEKPSRLPQLTDIALKEGGTMIGRITDREGKLLSQQKIVVRQENRLVAEVTSGKNGEFIVEGLRGGIYEIASQQGVGSFRAWAEGTAPPSAKHFALLVENGDVVRGQWGWMPNPSQYRGTGLSVGQWVGITLGAAGLVVGTIALVRDNDAS